MKFILISLLMVSVMLLGSDKKELYSKKDALKISKLNGYVIFTGLKNKGLFKLSNNTKTEILSLDKTIINIYENDGKLNIETSEGYYSYNGSILSKVNTEKQLVKQVERKIYTKTSNGWLKISPNTNDIFYAPRQKNNLILFSGLKTGLMIYDINTKTTNFISKGVDASFSKDGKSIVFAKVYDDGEKYTDSETFIYDIKTKKISKILEKDGKIKRFPYLINNTLYINIDFNIYELSLDKE